MSRSTPQNKAEAQPIFCYRARRGDQVQSDNAVHEEDADEDKKIVKSSLLQTLRVATVGNFQGGEARVVVISLVRSNPQSRCGFLRTPNRINVLLSRA